MQIHELTQFKRLDEGIVDALKVALNNDPAIDGMNYKQAKQYLATSKATKAIAQKAQQAWEVYARQLEQFASTSPVQQPAVATATATAKATPAPAPGTQIQTSQGPVNKTPDGQWKTAAGVTITDPADVAELERRSKQQITIAGQNKQMSKASGIKEDAPTAPAATTNSLTAFKNRTDGRYQQALKAFVQKNLLSGMPYNRLANAQEIDQIIKNISAPGLDPSKAAELWQQLALAAAVTYTVPQSSGGLEAPATPGGAEKEKTTTDTVDPGTLAAAIKNKANVDAAALANIGRTVRADFADNEDQIKSTGNPAVDALLQSMGFSV